MREGDFYINKYAVGMHCYNSARKKRLLRWCKNSDGGCGGRAVAGERAGLHCDVSGLRGIPR